MSGLCLAFAVLFNLLPPQSDTRGINQIPADTSSINSRNNNLILNARQNPDLVIQLARQTLRESNSINYLRGKADASLALGSAWLALYFNTGDSALYYNMQAYEMYRELDHTHGKARACYYLSYVFSIKGELGEAERYASLSLNFFEETDDKRGMINAYNVLSYFAEQQNDFKKALALIQQAIDIALATHDTIPLADVTNSLGNIYHDMTLFSQAIDAYFEALRLWELKGDSSGIANAYGNIGLMYYHQEEWDKALEFCFNKLAIAKARNDLWEVTKTYNTIATIYNAKNESDSALIYFREGLNMDQKMNYPSRIASAYNNIASTFLLLGKPDSAEWYINKALEIANKITTPELVNYYITLANVLKTRGRKNEALENVSKAYKIGKEQKLPLAVYDASVLLSDLYSSINRDDLAYKYLKEHYQLKDSIINADFLRQVTRMELQYDFDKKQKAAEFERMEEKIRHENKIRQQKSAMLVLLILIVLIVLISFLLLRHSRLRSKYARIDLEQRLLRAQMNPHFIFNSLCAVQDFILSGKSREANTFLTRIARLMRNILENSREEYISLEKEIETVKLYLELQQLRFDKGFIYTIDMDKTIDPENISIPPMFTQPCVENSIEHGLLPSPIKGQLEISYKFNNGLIKLEVTDNGIGRKMAAGKNLKNKDKKSVSTQVTMERLDNFRKTLRQRNITIEIADLLENDQPAGTKVIIMLPYKKLYA